MSNKNKLEQIFGEIRQSKWNEAARQRKEKRQWLHYSQKIALAVLEQLDRQNITQKALAERMEVSPQLVNKWLKGSENFTLETISKLEAVLGISLLQIELKAEKLSVSKELVFHITGTYDSPKHTNKPSGGFKTAKVIALPRAEYIQKVI